MVWLVRPKKLDKDKKYLITFRFNYHLITAIKNSDNYNKKVEEILNDNIEKLK